jgi:tetratricopeptide (TPR) repeat protein
MVGEEGDFSLAQKLGEEAIELFRKAGDIPSIVYALNTIGMAAAEQDEHERAAAYYIEALEIAREYGNVYQMGVVTWCLALAYLNLGDAHKARVLLEESIDHGRKQGSKGANSSRLIGMAGVIAALGEPERAARLLGAGEAGVESTNFQCDPVVRIENERIRAAIRGRLDDATFKEAIAAGRALTLEQAIALAAERTPA